ncbi:FAD-dependent oxidoreductase [Desulfonema ishimotonii]|uniref:FAD-dependent oxidoreductase n=1 Tax=Desulfonema ishimotonii TaxID=45657 RepID=A0A401FVX1_9BACT|nr:FAD-dependent oxidoreductase [Desulfonema ishimotonii]GBC61110.1 FAD-dependent oxidoreductase [Desulfonema ishimotonii]
MFGKYKPLWKQAPLQSAYDAVIVGGGVHGLAAAYYLARYHGMKNIAVLEKHHIGFGGSGRNTAIVRANQRYKEEIPLYAEGLRLWPELTSELRFNLMFFNCGLLTLAHSEADLSGMRRDVASARFMGVESRMLDPVQCQKLVPELDISDVPEFPVRGAMFHPPGGTLRHDAVVWGLAKGASEYGVHIHSHTAVTGIGTEGGKIVSVETSQGSISTPRLLNAAGAYSSHIAEMAGLRLPVRLCRVQAAVTQPLKPFLNHIISSGAYPCYANQTLKGEVVSCGIMVPAPDLSNQTEPDFLRHQAWAITQLLPCLSGARFMRTWGGLADLTPDMWPIIDGNVPLEGYFTDCGWGDFGFKSGPVTGKYMAEYMATGQCPDILKPFALKRFGQFAVNSDQ